MEVCVISDDESPSQDSSLAVTAMKQNIASPSPPNVLPQVGSTEVCVISDDESSSSDSSRSDRSDEKVPSPSPPAILHQAGLKEACVISDDDGSSSGSSRFDRSDDSDYHETDSSPDNNYKSPSPNDNEHSDNNPDSSNKGIKQSDSNMLGHLWKKDRQDDEGKKRPASRDSERSTRASKVPKTQKRDIRYALRERGERKITIDSSSDSEDDKPLIGRYFNNAPLRAPRAPSSTVKGHVNDDPSAIINRSEPRSLIVKLKVGPPKAEISRLKAELKQCRDELTTTKKWVHDAHADNAKLQREHERELDWEQQRSEEAERQLRGREGRHAETKAECQRLKTRLERSTAENASLVKQRDELQWEIDTTIRPLEKEAAKLKRQLDEERKAHSNDTNRANIAAEKVRAELEASKKQVRDLEASKKQVKELEAANQKLKTEIEDSQTEKQKLKTEIEDSHTEKQKLKIEVADLQIQNSTLSSANTDSAKNAKKETDDAAEEEGANSDENQEDRIVELEGDLEDLQAELSETRLELTNKSIAVTILEDELKQARDEFEQAESEKEKLARKLQTANISKNLSPSGSSIPSLSAAELEQRSENLRRENLRWKKKYDILFPLAKDISLATAGMDLSSFGEFGGYVRKLRAAVGPDQGAKEVPVKVD